MEEGKEPRVVAAPILTRFFKLNDDAAVRSQVTQWYAISEFVFKIANWMTLLGLFQFIADKTKSIPAGIVLLVLALSFFGIIGSSATYFVFTPLRETTETRKGINLLVHVIVALIVYFGLLVAVNSIVGSISQLKG